MSTQQIPHNAVPTLQQNVEAEFGALMFRLLSVVTERDVARAENAQLHATLAERDARIAELEAAQRPAE